MNKTGQTRFDMPALKKTRVHNNTAVILDDWLTAHRSITLFDFQLDTQNSYLFVYNTFIKILYMFRALPSSSSGGLRRNCIYTASGIVTLSRYVREEINFLSILSMFFERSGCSSMCEISHLWPLGCCEI
jgi:hypothetical protein